MTSNSLENFYYGKQLKTYIVQYMAIFSGLKVQIGKNDFNPQTDKIEVPISYGSKDRVVAAIKAENTQTNKPIRVPTMSAYMMGIEIDTDLYSGIDTIDSDVHLPLGNTLPDGLKVIRKLKPIPYRMRMETTIYASNSDQRMQMLEQILMLFTPTLQIQTSDNFDDGTKITTVKLENIIFNEEYPSGTSRRIITDTFEFSLPVYLSLPFDVRDDYIKKIRLRISLAAQNQSTSVLVDEISRQFGDEGYETLIDINDEKIPEK